MFHRILIANRGEVAVRIAKGLRSLGISPIGVASAPDLAGSWTEVMDEVVCLGGAAAADSYLHMEKLVQAARQTRCSALHPGWGFLAENKRFAALCEQHGVVFIGPSPSVMAVMGIKSPAKKAMALAGLDVVPGSDGPIATLEEAVISAKGVGYPIILKADFGGGGRGMRLCHDEAELREAFSAAGAEAQASFGSGSIYLERYLTAGRHIEVQILGDQYGNAIHLGERECSIQRKHQKLIEESPSPALTPEERAALGERAASAAARVGYASAGTIEFLRADSGEIFFMEMNTRLQVEHPVSEMVSGVDIVAKQVEIAANRPLGLTQEEITFQGHAIECRINAEDPHDDFRPSPGRLESFEFPADRGPGTVRVDTHMRAGDEVTPYYDSLIAKVIAHADTREQAIETMIASLSAASLEGVKTTIPLHLAVLQSDEFRRGEYDTSTIPGWSNKQGA
jgi:acetyl-CoA carboxylase, biotin carboxylase subunit